MPYLKRRKQSPGNKNHKISRDAKENIDTASIQDQGDAVSSTERTNKRRKYIGHNLSVFMTSS